IQPSLFYQWQEQVLDNLAAALTTPPPPGPSRREKELASENTQLKTRLTKKDSVIAEISAEYVQLKKRTWGALSGCWVPHVTRDAVVDFVHCWSEKTEIPIVQFVTWIGVARGKFFDWSKRYGKANEHNALVPRDHWLMPEEKAAIIAFHELFPLEGYRR